MNVLLFTGKGGVGKTTVAAATAALAAARGRKTLVLSTDPAHSLSDAVGVALGDEPAELDTGFYGLQVDTQRAFERTWRDVQGYLAAVLQRAGVDPVAAEELTVLPGAGEVLALLELRAQAAGGRWDLVVVDCAPTGETLRLLALPEALSWYVERLFPAHRRALRAVRPLLARAAGPPLPDEPVLDAVARLHAELGAVRQLLTAADTAVRLVLTPEAVVVAETRRALTGLALHGYRVDALVANRVFPPAPPGAGSWWDGWVGAQDEQLAAVRADAAPLPVLTVPYQGSEPVGLPALTDLATELYAGRDPLAGPAEAADAPRVERDGEAFVLSVPLPLAEPAAVDLARVHDDLVVTVGGHRRRLTLPSALRRCEVTGATLAKGRLAVRFIPDPQLWLQP